MLIHPEKRPRLTEIEVRRVYLPLLEAVVFLLDRNATHGNLSLQDILLNDVMNVSGELYWCVKCLQNRRPV